MGMLPPVVATLVADTKEYSAKMDEATAKMGELGAAAEKSGSKFNSYLGKASTAVLGLGVALGGYALDKAFSFQEGLDKLQNQAGISAVQAKKLGDAILNISSATGATTPDLMSAALAVEQAGVRGAKAQQLLNDAAKSSVITGQSVTDTAKSIVSVQQLQIAKGLSLADVTGLLTAGAQHTVGGMTALAGVLQGRVGVALANTGMKMKDIVTVGAEFSTVGLQSRAAATFATALSKLDGPLTTTHVTTKRTYTTLSTYALALKAVGLSQAQLASTMRTGGLPALLNELKDAAAGSTPKLQELLQVVFGSTGAASASLLVNHLKQISKIQQQMAGAGAGSLETGFKGAVKQLGPQLHILESRFNVMFTRIGEHLLPAMSAVEGWAIQFTSKLEKSGSLRSGLATAFGAALAIAASVKAAQVGTSIAIAFGADASLAGVAGPIGAAIGVAIMEAIKIGGAQNFADLITGKGVGRKKAGENIAGALWNANVGLAEGFLKAFTGNPLALLHNQQIPDWMAYHQAPSVNTAVSGRMASRLGPGGSGRSGPVSVRVTHRTKYGR